MDFTSMEMNTTKPTEFTSANAQNGVLNLSKGTFLDLTKAAPFANEVDLRVGWDISQNATAYDLDISLMMLDANGKIVDEANLGNSVLFYNNPDLGYAKLLGDNRTGAGDGDDETIQITLSQVPANVHNIVTVVSIDQAIARKQVFGQVDNSYVRLVNRETEEEIARMELKDNASTYTVMLFAELTRNANGWNFHNIQEGLIGDLNTVLNKFM